MNVNAGQVLIVCATDSFLAKGLLNKLLDAGIRASFTHATVKEIEPFAEHTDLVLLFMSEELDQFSEPLVYLKDLRQEKEMGLFVISDDTQYDYVKKTIPEHTVTEWFERPLDIEMLIRRVESYLDENTGEKAKKTVLIVDDDITYMRTVYEWLKDSYHVGMAANGVQAIAYLTKNKADLVLLDYEMPIANGRQVLSMLKDDAEMGQIPVMFLTGHDDKESVLSVIGLRPADYLLKTIGKDALLTKLNEFFHKK